MGRARRTTKTPAEKPRGQHPPRTHAAGDDPGALGRVGGFAYQDRAENRSWRDKRPNDYAAAVQAGAQVWLVGPAVRVTDLAETPNVERYRCGW